METPDAASVEALYIEGPPASGKTSQLVARAAALIGAGEGPRLLILASNPLRQRDLAERLLARLSQPMGELPLRTFGGFVRNALFNAWPAVEARIAKADPRGRPRIRPSLGGMGDSEFLMRLLIAEARQRDAAFFAAFEGSDLALVKQLTRRLRLRAENRLTRLQMRQRSESRQEACAAETAWLDAAFDRLCYALRALDANKQIEAFFGLLDEEGDFAASIRATTRHLLAEDLDEATPALQAFVLWLAPSLRSLVLTCDPEGGSRQGYLNAWPQGWPALKAARPGRVVTLNRDDARYENAQILARNWQRAPQEAETLNPTLTLAPMTTTRLEMLDAVAQDVLGWLDAGRAPGEIVIVSPQDDPLTRQALRARLHTRGAPLQWLSGTERPYDEPACRAYIALLHWINALTWGAPLSPVEIRALLTHGLRLPALTPVALQTIAAEWSQALAAGRLPEIGDAWPEGARRALAPFLEWTAQARQWPFETQLYRAFSEIISERALPGESFFAIQRAMESYVSQKALWSGLNELNDPSLLAAVLPGDARERSGEDAFNRRWLSQVKSGAVADTPDVPLRPDPEATLIATPQKIIDADARRAIQLWLDAGSRHWMRTDRAPLYDAAAYGPAGASDAAANEGGDAARDAMRAGRVTRGLLALAGERVRVYASEVDDVGEPQTGPLLSRLKTADAQTPDLTAIPKPVLRPDQRPILAYRRGTMAVSAAPGAGKTYVNTALILELIASGVAPQSILALTYMDSAARTLQSRLKKLLGPHAPLPTVCTIHSLALRLLNEADHAVRADFFPSAGEEGGGILDESQQDALLSPIAEASCPQGLTPNAWRNALRRGISHAKTFRLSPERLAGMPIPANLAFRLKPFLAAYAAYQERLRATGRVDFTDLIVKAVSLLENHEDVRRLYQARFAYILEDEAQDSSALLQRLLTLLGGASPNLIRTGDPNQSITTTFSAADPQAFREFAASADHRVTLDRSGRCAPEIMALANAWLTAMRAHPELGEAFSPMEMRAVAPEEGPPNPPIWAAPQAVWHERDDAEADWLVAQAQAFQSAHPGASVAVLTLTNEQALAWSQRLRDAQVDAIAVTDRLNVNGAFATLHRYLRLLASPDDCQAQTACYDAMVEAGVTAPAPERREFLSRVALMGQSPSDLRTLNDEFLMQWAYDLRDFSADSLGRNVSRLLTRLSDRLFASTADRSSGYACAIRAHAILRARAGVEPDRASGPASGVDVSLSPLEIVIAGFDELSRSPARQRRSFAELLNDSAASDGFVRVMTLHKAKGQEFDLVMMPGLRADAVDAFRFDEGDRLILALESLRQTEFVAGGGDSQTAALNGASRDALQRSKREERARLIYVGLTRARRALMLSGARLARDPYSRKMQASEPSLAFETLSRLITRDAPRPDGTPSTAVESASTGPPPRR